MAEKEYTDDDLITCLWCGGSTPHETAVGECCWHELRLRLAASNALCAELAEALKGTVKELGEVIKSAESEAVHFDGDDFHERLTAGMKALAKFKEATR